jgi:uncharacterized repeat protein (TIGR01451 family)
MESRFTGKFQAWWLVVTLALVAVQAVGASPREERATRAAKLGSPAPGGKSVPEAKKENRGELNTGVIQLTKTVPAQVRTGDEFSYELKLTALVAAGNVELEDQLPEGAKYVRSEPSAEAKDKDLIWKFRLLDKGDTRTVKVWLKTEKDGALLTGATVSADRRAVASTFVGKPALSLTQAGPEVAATETEVAYLVTIANRGNVLAKDVVITNELPAGLTRSRPELDTNLKVGDLAPGQSKSFPLILKASVRGKLCNRLAASGSNAEKASDELCTTFAATDLQLTIAGDAKGTIGQPARYRIRVFNSGDTKLTGLIVTSAAPAGARLLQAPDAVVANGIATWAIGELSAGDEKNLELTLSSTTGGRQSSVAEAVTGLGLKRKAETITEWK